MKLSLLAFLMLAASVFGAVITPPSQYVTSWIAGTNVGVPGGFTRFQNGGVNARTNSGIDVTAAPYNCDITGVADSYAGLQAAITAAAATPERYLLLPEGVFKLSQGLVLPSNFTLRGAGQNADRSFKTVLRPTGSGALGAGTGGVSFANTYTITAGLTTGATDITIASTSAYTAGDICWIKFSNVESNADIIAGYEPIMHTYGSPNVRLEIVRVASVLNGTQLRLENPITHHVFASTTAKISRAQSGSSDGKFIGIEALEVNGSDSNTLSYSFVGTLLYGSWIDRCSFRFTKNYHVAYTYSINCEVVSSVCDSRSIGGTNGSGILVNSTTRSLFENNVIKNIVPGIEVNFGSCGNVFAYNFADGAGTNFNVNHGAHNSFNLFEGNIVPQFQSDGYFGGSSRDTFWRNWITGRYESQEPPAYVNDPVPFSLNRFTRYYQVYGNLVSRADWWPMTQPNATGLAYSFGNPNISNSGYTGSISMLAGEFGEDWGIQGTVTKISDYEMTIVVTKGDMEYYGQANNTPGQRIITYLPPSEIGLGPYIFGVNGFDVAGITNANSTIYTTLTRLWYIEGTKDSGGNLVGSWSAPRQLNSMGYSSNQRCDQAEFSADGSSWHFGFQSGDTWMRKRATAGAYSSSIDIAGETSGGGNYTDYRFQWTENANLYENIVSSVNEPSGWTDVPADPNFGAYASASVINIYPGNAGFQELDEDVETTTTLLGNAHMHQGATIPVAQAIPTGDTLKASLYRTSAPSWWDTVSYTWPPFDSTAPVASYSRIPAGAEFLFNIEPEVVSANIAASGTTLVVTFSKQVTVGSGGVAGLTVSYSGVTATYASGSGTVQLTFTMSRTIFDDEVGTLSWSGTTNGLEDSNGVDLNPFSGLTIFNYSNETGGAVWFNSIALADANSTVAYYGPGWTLAQKVTVSQSGLLVKARLHIGEIFSVSAVSVAVYDASRALVTTGTGSFTEQDNYTLINLTSTQIAAGDYWFTFQGGANNDPILSTKSSASAPIQFTTATTYANFPVDPLPATQTGLTYSLVAGLRVIPDQSTYRPGRLRRLRQ